MDRLPLSHPETLDIASTCTRPLPRLSLLTCAYIEEIGVDEKIVKAPSGLNLNKIRTAELFSTLSNFPPFGHALKCIYLELPYKAPLRTLVTYFLSSLGMCSCVMLPQLDTGSSLSHTSLLSQATSLNALSVAVYTGQRMLRPVPTVPLTSALVRPTRW